MTYNVININQEILGGTPVFNGTRAPLQALFDYIEDGEPVDEFSENFPTVTREQAIQVLEITGKLITPENVLHEHFASKRRIRKLHKRMSEN